MVGMPQPANMPTNGELSSLGRGTPLFARPVAPDVRASEASDPSSLEPKSSSVRVAHPGILRLQRWVESNGAAALTLRLAEAAQIARLEPHYFSTVFRRHVGIGFRTWRRRLRASQAAHALAGGGRSIISVTAEVGYAERRSLERAIRAVHGVTPHHFTQSPAEGQVWVRRTK